MLAVKSPIKLKAFGASVYDPSELSCIVSQFCSQYR